MGRWQMAVAERAREALQILRIEAAGLEAGQGAPARKLSLACRALGLRREERPVSGALFRGIKKMRRARGPPCKAA